MLTLSEQKEKIIMLMEYAVPEDDRAAAVDLVEKHGADIIALNLFYTFYSHLPEGREDRVRILRLLARREGVFLLGATTLIEDYLYVVSTEMAVFLGRASDGIMDKELLGFLGLKDRNESIERFKDFDGCKVYKPGYLDGELCPVCFVADSEYHVFGCPVEVCPWCGGQLSRCDCRFEQLGTNSLDSESELDEFYGKVNEKGRVLYDAAAHRPAYHADDEED